MKQLPIDEFGSELAREAMKAMSAKGGNVRAATYSKEKLAEWSKKGMASRWKGHIKKSKALRKNFPCPHCVERLKNNPNLKMA